MENWKEIYVAEDLFIAGSNVANKALASGFNKEKFLTLMGNIFSGQGLVWKNYEIKFNKLKEQRVKSEPINP